MNLFYLSSNQWSPDNFQFKIFRLIIIMIKSNPCSNRSNVDIDQSLQVKLALQGIPILRRLESL